MAWSKKTHVLDLVPFLRAHWGGSVDPLLGLAEGSRSLGENPCSVLSVVPSCHTLHLLIHCRARLYHTLPSLWIRSAVSSLLEWAEIPLKPQAEINNPSCTVHLSKSFTEGWKAQVKFPWVKRACENAAFLMYGFRQDAEWFDFSSSGTSLQCGLRKLLSSLCALPTWSLSGANYTYGKSNVGLDFGSGVKSGCCTCRQPEFNFYHPCWVGHSCL